MKTIQSYSINIKTAESLQKMAKSLERSKSTLAERYIEEGLARDSIISIKCPKCGASYSSKLSECPGCRK